MATTINDVNTIQIRNAKNGDFDLNLSGGGGGESKPFYPIVTFDDQMQVTDIQQGVVSAKGGTVIGRMGGEEQPFSVITLSAFSQGGLTNRYFVSVFYLGVFELILNASNEITETQFINGRISVCGLAMRTINSHEIGNMGTSYPVLISVDESTEEETITQFTGVQGGKKLHLVNTDIVPLNYGVTDNVLFYNKGVNDITFDANAEWYEIVSV